MENEVDLLVEQLGAEQVLILPDEAHDDAEEGFDYAVVVRVATGSNPNKVDFIKTLKKIWRTETETVFSEVSHNTMIVNVVSSNTLDRILSNGPWVCRDNWLILADKWETGARPDEIHLHKFKIWATFFNLPLNYAKNKPLKHIGAYLGNVIKVIGLPDNAKVENVVTMKFAKVFVEMDVRKPLPHGCFVDRREGDPFWTDIRYEKLPNICFKCGMLTHTTNSCVRADYERTDDGRRKYGGWIKDDGSEEARHEDTYVVPEISKSQEQDVAMHDYRRQQQACRRDLTDLATTYNGTLNDVVNESAVRAQKRENEKAKRVQQDCQRVNNTRRDPVMENRYQQDGYLAITGCSKHVPTTVPEVINYGENKELKQNINEQQHEESWFMHAKSSSIRFEHKEGMVVTLLPHQDSRMKTVIRTHDVEDEAGGFSNVKNYGHFDDSSYSTVMQDQPRYSEDFNDQGKRKFEIAMGSHTNFISSESDGLKLKQFNNESQYMEGVHSRHQVEQDEPNNAAAQGNVTHFDDAMRSFDKALDNFLGNIDPTFMSVIPNEALDQESCRFGQMNLEECYVKEGITDEGFIGFSHQDMLEDPCNHEFREIAKAKNMEEQVPCTRSNKGKGILLPSMNDTSDLPQIQKRYEGMGQSFEPEEKQYDPFTIVQCQSRSARNKYIPALRIASNKIQKGKAKVGKSVPRKSFPSGLYQSSNDFYITEILPARRRLKESNQEIGIEEISESAEQRP